LNSKWKGRFAVRRSIFLAAVLGILVCAPTSGRVLAATAISQAPATPAEAAPFVGDWALTMEGQNGPAMFAVKVKVDGDKVAGEISSDQMALTPIRDIRKNEKSLVLGFSFDYNGMPVDAVVTLTPGADEKTAATIDFAGGAYVMNGTAAKKAAK